MMKRRRPMADPRVGETLKAGGTVSDEDAGDLFEPIFALGDGIEAMPTAWLRPSQWPRPS